MIFRTILLLASVVFLVTPAWAQFAWEEVVPRAGAARQDIGRYPSTPQYAGQGRTPTAQQQQGYSRWQTPTPQERYSGQTRYPAAPYSQAQRPAYTSQAPTYQAPRTPMYSDYGKKVPGAAVYRPKAKTQVKTRPTPPFSKRQSTELNRRIANNDAKVHADLSRKIDENSASLNNHETRLSELEKAAKATSNTQQVPGGTKQQSLTSTPQSTPKSPATKEAGWVQKAVYYIPSSE